MLKKKESYGRFHPMVQGANPTSYTLERAFAVSGSACVSEDLPINMVE
jgi:hypothetical protein